MTDEEKLKLVTEYALNHNGITSFETQTIIPFDPPGVQKSKAERWLLERGFYEHHNEWYGRGDRVYCPPECAR